MKRDIGRKSQFLPRDAMQARHISLCGVYLSVCVSVCHVRTFCQNE